jgi:hypothetical protein
MDYEAKPSDWHSNPKAEPVFAPGGLKRLVVFTVTVTVFYWIASTIGPLIYHGLGGT